VVECVDVLLDGEAGPAYSSLAESGTGPLVTEPVSEGRDFASSPDGGGIIGGGIFSLLDECAVVAERIKAAFPKSDFC
jgi:hypothetical protein